MGRRQFSRGGDAGAAHGTYAADNGDAPDAFGAAHTFETPDPMRRVEILIEDNTAIVQFKDSDSNWGDDVKLVPGGHTRTLDGRGVRIKNETAGQTAAYNIERYA